MEFPILAIVAVICLAWLNKWNEARLARKILKSMDTIMGRDA